MSIICYCICTKRGYGVEKDRMRQRDCQEGRGVNCVSCRRNMANMMSYPYQMAAFGRFL